MSSHKPPPRTLDPEQDRKVQLFLERAAPVVLERRVIDTQSWGELLALAEELELTEPQMRATIDDLKERGVIERIDLSPPKPPPLPVGDGTQPAPPAEVSLPPELPEQEDDFSLAPPAPPPRATSGEDRLTEVERRKRFVDQARMIIGEQRGMGPKAQSLLTATAEELGLSDRQMREALQEVVREPRAEPPEDTLQTSRWRIEGQPIPDPAPPKKKPSETYRDFVQRSLDKFAGEGVVSVDLEEGILKHGTKVLRLSQVYARHLIQEVAESGGLRVASAETGAQRDQPAEQDLKVTRFGERAAPILAQHRGLNAKSRVLLAAVATEIGLGEEQMENAIATLQQESGAGPGVDSIQRERLELFRIFLRNSMQRIPRGLLTPNIEAMLIESGENLHGVAAELVRPTIREIADELQLSVITAEQAVDHVENLVQQKLGDDFILKSDVRERIRSEGEQWGLPASQVDAIIRTNTQSNYRRRRSEQSFTNLALCGAGIAVLLVISFLAWAMLGGEMASYDIPEEPHSSEPILPLAPANIETERDNSWWDDDLSIAAANTRLEFPLLRRRISEIASVDPARRSGAYKELVDHFLHRTTSDLHRRVFLELLSRCYALEPNDESADVIARALLGDVPGPEDRLSEDAQVYPSVFWAVRAAVAALAEESIAEERAARLSIPLSRVLGASFDYQQNRRSLEQACLGALAERLYRLLTTSVDGDPDTLGSLQGVIAKEAARYLDSSELDKLNAEFLVGVLDATPSEWRRYEALLVRTLRSSDPLAVVRLVDLYESTTEEDLQHFLGALLVRALGTAGRPMTVAEVAAEVRRSLGVTEDVDSGRRWLRFSKAAKSELAESRAGSDEASELFRATAQLARLSTLGCALAQGETGQRAFDDLVDRPIGAMADVDSSAEPTSAGDRELTESEGRQLQIAVRALTDERAEDSASYRAPHVNFLAGLAERVSHLAPLEASKLARYLLRKKGDNEHKHVMDRMPALRRWKNLRLAVADELDRAKLASGQLRQLVNSLTGGDFSGTNVNAMRVALLQNVRADLFSAGPVSGKEEYDQGLRELLGLYKIQAELLGVPAADFDEATRPSAVLRGMIEHRAGSIAAGALPEDLSAILASLPFQLTAIDYVATDDLRRTVMLERLWLQLLSIEAAGKNSRTARDARALVDELNRSERPSAALAALDLETSPPEDLRLVAQLRDGQVALLRMWILINRPN